MRENKIINFYPYEIITHNEDKYMLTSRDGGIYLLDSKIEKILEFEGKSINEIKILLANDNNKEEYLNILNDMEENIIIQSIKNNDVIENSKNLTLDYSGIEILVTQGCNLRCSYCYGDGGTYNDKGTMDLDTGKKVINFSIKNCKKDILGIVFFGGEPLMNYQLIKELVAYSLQLSKKYNKKIKFAMTTNGILVNEEIAKFLSDNKFSITISIDGTEDIHNQNRYYINKKGSYEDVVKGITLLVKYKNMLAARATCSPNNINMINTQNHLEEIGFKAIFISPSINLFNKKEDFDLLLKNYNELLSNFKTRLDNKEYNKVKLIRTLFKIMETMHTTSLRNRFCGAGVNVIGINRNGQIYPCHRFVGNNEYMIGNVYDGIDKEKYNKYIKQELALASRNKCSSCWAYMLCGGGCPNENYSSNGTCKEPIEPLCKVQKHLIKEISKIYVSLNEEQKDNLF